MTDRVKADMQSRSFDEVVTIFLGDYVDRGLGSMPVVDKLSRGEWPTPIVALAGNHEDLLLAFLEDEPALGRLLVVDALGAGPKALEHRALVLSVLIETVEQGRVTQIPRKHRGKPSLTAEGIVGAVFSVIHARLLEHHAPSSVYDGVSKARSPRNDTLSALTNPLMSVIVTPYLGQTVARAELDRSTPKTRRTPSTLRANPLRDLNIRLTYRTARVLNTIAEHPEASNRQIGEHAGIHDQGQISKLLARLHKLDLIHNTTPRHTNRGGPNHWTLTPTGQDIHHAISTQVAP